MLLATAVPFAPVPWSNPRSSIATILLKFFLADSGNPGMIEIQKSHEFPPLDIGLGGSFLCRGEWCLSLFGRRPFDGHHYLVRFFGGRRRFLSRAPRAPHNEGQAERN